MSVICVAKQQEGADELVLQGIRVTMVCIDNPTYYFEGFTDLQGKVHEWIGYGRGTTPNIGPVLVLSADNTRWHFTFFMPQGHPSAFPSVSIDFYMSGDQQHRIVLLIGSSTYGVFLLDEEEEDEGYVSAREGSFATQEYPEEPLYAEEAEAGNSTAVCGFVAERSPSIISEPWVDTEPLPSPLVGLPTPEDQSQVKIDEQVEDISVKLNSRKRKRGEVEDGPTPTRARHS